MVITAVTSSVNASLMHVSMTLGAILICCFIASLIAKEVLSHHNQLASFARLHFALKLIWVPLTAATVLVLAQQIIGTGMFK